MRNLKYLAPLSTLANVVTILSFGIIFYFLFRDPITLEGKEAVGSISKFPFFLGTVLFSLESVGVVSINSTTVAEKRLFKISEKLTDNWVIRLIGDAIGK